MIDLGSVAGLHEHDHELHAYCARCDAWRLLPLGEEGQLGLVIAATADHGEAQAARRGEP